MIMSLKKNNFHNTKIHTKLWRYTKSITLTTEDKAHETTASGSKVGTGNKLGNGSHDKEENDKIGEADRICNSLKTTFQEIRWLLKEIKAGVKKINDVKKFPIFNNFIKLMSFNIHWKFWIR